MLLNYYLGVSLPFVGGLLVIVLFAWLWKKMKKNPVAGGTVGFFIGIIVAAILFIAPGNVYIVTGNAELSKCVLIGSSSYTMEDGSSVSISSSIGYCTVINDSDEDLVVEHVIYGYGFEEDDYVPVGGVVNIDASNIEHFFDEIPPETIETSGSGSYAVRLWLRSYADYDADYLEQEEMDDLRDLLQESIDERSEEE